MTRLAAITDLDAYVATRTSWHTLAEHILTKARWAQTTKIGLRVADGGFGTPSFGDDLRVFVNRDGIHRVQFGETTSAPISTVRAAAEFLQIDAGAPADVFVPSNPCDLNRSLVIDAVATQVLGDWFAFGNDVLSALRTAHDHESPSLVQLWPEHFDVAVDFGNAAAGTRANFGVSPGDAAIPMPYIYVGPWDMNSKGDDPFWNQPWGAALTCDALCAAPDPVAAASSFYEHGATRL